MLAAAIVAATYLGIAKDAARWIDSQPTPSADLYYGSPGVVLLDLNLYRATGEAKYLERAKAAGDDLLTRIDAADDPGLYTGVAGIGYSLVELWKTTSDAKYHDGAARCVIRIRQLGENTFDIISGTAGIGLFLLYASHELHDPEALALARCAADRLMETRAAETTGVSWADTTSQVVMPNFSHGTAGAAYFLASIYLDTKERRYLDAALEGGRHLISIAATEGNECLIYHHTPGGENLYYLGWCHGPAGTARLFYRLYQATHDPKWLQWVDRAAQSIIDSGIPERHTPGFWNNVSVCCGSAGVARFFLDLYRSRGDRKYLIFARRVAEQLIATATRDDDGARWPQAEHRVKPELIVAQTGYMQGAAGIASVLLDVDAVERGKSPRFTLPDSPF